MKNLFVSVMLIFIVFESQATSVLKKTAGYCRGEDTVGSVIVTIAGINSTAKIINIGLNKYKKGLQIKIDAEKAAINGLEFSRDTKEVITDTGKSLKDIGEGLSMVPVGEDLESAGEGMTVAAKDFVDPTYTIFDRIVEILALEDQLKADEKTMDLVLKIQKGITHIKYIATVVSSSCFIIKNIDNNITHTSKDTVQNDLYVKNESLFKPVLASNNSSQETISDQCLNSFNQTLTDLKDPMTSLKKDLDTLANPLTEIANSMSLLTPALSPITTIAHDISELKKVVDKLHQYNSELKHLLKKKIHFKVAGVIVLNYSVDDVMKKWKSIEKKIEKTVGLGAAKKYIKHELTKIMEPVEKKVAHEAKSKIMKVKFKGFDLNDMKSKFDAVKGLENYLKMDEAALEKDRQTLENWEHQCLPKNQQTA